MRSRFYAGGLAILCSLGFASEATAVPTIAPPHGQQALTPLEFVQVGPGYYRKKFYRQRMRQYRNNPGARYELQQRRQRFCRAAPSRC